MTAVPPEGIRQPATSAAQAGSPARVAGFGLAPSGSPCRLHHRAEDRPDARHKVRHRFAAGKVNQRAEHRSRCAARLWRALTEILVEPGPAEGIEIKAAGV